MNFSEFKESLAKTKPPAELTPALAALWWAGKDNWERAHNIVMDAAGKDSAWVHAYLHRVEGDLDNAQYWYRRAQRPVSASRLPPSGTRSLKACWKGSPDASAGARACELSYLPFPSAIGGRSASLLTVFLLTCSPPLSRNIASATAISAPKMAPSVPVGVPLSFIADSDHSD